MGRGKLGAVGWAEDREEHGGRWACVWLSNDASACGRTGWGKRPGDSTLEGAERPGEVSWETPKVLGRS